jgi:serine beta-lactamase-like protein LACTB
VRCHLLVAFVSLAVPLAGQQDADVQQRRDALVRDLAAFVEYQRSDQDLPAVCIAMGDAQGGSWAWTQAFGFADQARHTPATPLCVGRVASISKLFTATAVMALVEQGKLDLDTPVTKWLPEFHPKGEGADTITLRHLLSHKAGLVRESPVGHYFDASDPGLAATVASLNDTELVYPPGKTFKYSNPGPGVEGLVIEKVTGKHFEDAVRELVLAPLQLRDSDFAARPDLVARTPFATMGTPDGRAIPLPTFPFGYAPAANLRSTVTDLLAFAQSWLPDAKVRVLKPATQEAMWQVPFAEAGAPGCALGFFVRKFDGHRMVSHGGAVYGFASQLAALPDDGLAVAVIATADFANAVANAIAERALRGMLAAREGKALEPFVRPEPVGAVRARALRGRYALGADWFDLLARGEELYLQPANGYRVRMRMLGEELVSDDLASVGSVKLRVAEGAKGCEYRGKTWSKQPDVPPPACPPELQPWLGEYGWDFDKLVVFEDGGRLCVLIEWYVRAVLEAVGPGEFRFADGSMYSGDRVRFQRGADGAVTGVTVGGTLFPAVPWPKGPFRITPVRPVAELRASLPKAEPPAAPTNARQSDLVDLTEAVPGVRLEVRYASEDNFLGTKVYDVATSRMQRPAAAALARVQAKLKERGLGLLVYDAYRPWSVTRLFWEATPPSQHEFVADPGKGSRHNRGCAVDLTLVDLVSGKPVPMPSGYDEFTVRAYPDWPGGTALERWNRETLRQLMAAEGFTVYEYEWWHHDFEAWREYPVLDQPLR